MRFERLYLEFAAKVMFTEKKKNQTNTTFKLFVKVVF